VLGPFGRDFACPISENLIVKKYEPNLLELMQSCDLVVSKAGYNSTNEILFSRKPAVLIPVFRGNDDQYERAKYFSDKGLVKMIDFDSGRLADFVKEMYSDRGRLNELTERLEQYNFIRDNTDTVYEISRFLREKKHRLKLGRECNNNCVYCQDLSMKAPANRTFKEIEEEVRELKKKGVTTIELPCNTDVRKDFMVIVRMIKNRSMKVVLFTNGRMFYYRDFVEEVAGYIDKFNVFLNGFEEAHDKANHTLSYNQTIIGIKNLLQLDAKVQVNTVITNYNYQILSGFVSRINELGVRNWRPVFPVSVENEHIPAVIDSYEEIDKAIRFAESHN